MAEPISFPSELLDKGPAQIAVPNYYKEGFVSMKPSPEESAPYEFFAEGAVTRAAYLNGWESGVRDGQKLYQHINTPGYDFAEWTRIKHTLDNAYFQEMFSGDPWCTGYGHGLDAVCELNAHLKRPERDDD